MISLSNNLLYCLICWSPQELESSIFGMRLKIRYLVSKFCDIFIPLGLLTNTPTCCSFVMSIWQCDAMIMVVIINNIEISIVFGACCVAGLFWSFCFELVGCFDLVILMFYAFCFDFFYLTSFVLSLLFRQV